MALLKRRARTTPIMLWMVALSLLGACTDDTYFGHSEWNEIKEFTVSGQSGATVISKENDTVHLSVGSGVDRTDLVPSVFEISNFAVVSPEKDAPRDFSNPLEYVVRAENGVSRVWTVTINEIGEHPQLDNSNFNAWYETSAGIIGTPIVYMEPGESEETTLWATANFGLTKYKSQPNTTRVDLNDGNFAAKMETVKAPALVALAAATLFTGTFELNEINPDESAKFGIPFAGRPTGFRVRYTYVPGDDPIGVDADECDIYVLLENREDDSVARVATGWFRNGDRKDEWTTLEVPLKYGPLSPSDAEYEYADIKDGQTWADPEETPTHISVVFASSAFGDEYKGAIGSTLAVDAFELLYDW